MSQDYMRYDKLVDEALRGVVVEALSRAAAEGLPGDHHFFISFRTTDPGVHLPPAILAQYPAEMTIVLQHRFWDLNVGDEGFSVALSFAGMHQTLAIPYAAIKGFADPSVNFGLQFEGKVSESADSPAKAGSKKPTSGSPATKLKTAKPQTAKLKTAKQPAAAKESVDVVALDAFRKK